MRGSDRFDENGPPRLAPGLPLLAAAAATGLVLSLAAHITAIQGRPQPLGDQTMGLHAGCFVVWALTILVCYGLPSDVDGNRRFQELWELSPGWARRSTNLEKSWETSSPWARQSFSLEEFLKASPAWARRSLYILFGYLVFNMILCVAGEPGKPMKPRMGVEPSPEVVRSFSGHWIAFYGAALLILLCVPRVAAKGEVGADKPPRDDCDELLG